MKELGIFVALSIGLSAASAVSAYTVPAKGSTARRAILEALRPAIEARLGPRIEFAVTVIRVESGWAFVVADPQRRGGRPINGRAYFGSDFDNMDGLRVDAVLRLRKGRWALVDHAIGATDVWHCDIGPRSLKRGWGC